MYIFASESVTPGHPDKMADTISDLVLDEVLAQDPLAGVSVETFIAGNDITVAGKVTTRDSITLDVPSLVEERVKAMGYTAGMGYDPETLNVRDLIIRKQDAVPRPSGADDQGIMFGYACSETQALLPVPIALAHQLSLRLRRLWLFEGRDWLRPDGKTQVSAQYSDAGIFESLDTIVISTQHAPTISLEQLRHQMQENVIAPVIKEFGLSPARQVLINPAGEQTSGGPVGKVGLSGRKITVDTYGGAARHGGGAFSGKDPSKLDRSAAYALRYIAKAMVRAGMMNRCEIQAAYAIGVHEPVSVHVNHFGTAQCTEEDIQAFVSSFDLRPSGIINWLHLNRPIYAQSTNYGHFGREDAGLPWEDA